MPMSTTQPRHAIVPETCAGRRLDAVLAELFPEYSRSRLSAWIKSGDVAVDGAAARGRDPVRGGESVTLKVVEDVQTHAVAEDIPLELILADGSVHGEKGRFLLLDRQVDTTTGTFKIGAIFPNPHLLLRPGLFGKVRATVGTLQDALLVPQRAVTEIQGRYLIAVVGADNKVELRPVVPGERIGSEWVIMKGLKAGEVIVVEGTQKVRPGSPVVPRHPAPAQPGAATGDAAPKDAPPAAAPTEKPAPEAKG